MTDDTGGIIGFTDKGYPIVLPEHSCDHFARGISPLLQQKICWYCKYADFRKTCDVMLKQSICRCPENRVHLMPDSENDNYSDVN
jgi:hypothetical protein